LTYTRSAILTDFGTISFSDLRVGTTSSLESGNISPEAWRLDARHHNMLLIPTTFGVYVLVLFVAMGSVIGFVSGLCASLALTGDVGEVMKDAALGGVAFPGTLLLLSWAYSLHVIHSTDSTMDFVAAFAVATAIPILHQRTRRNR
jgi:hypothetical protein